jgi:hypothetical protein
VKKIFEKIFAGLKIVHTFAPAFEKAKFFKRFEKKKSQKF